MSQSFEGQTFPLHVVTLTTHYKDSINRDYRSSTRDVTKYMSLEVANSETQRMFNNMEAHYAPYSQYRTTRFTNQDGCLVCISACQMGEEPLGRRWKTVYATERRFQGPLNETTNSNGDFSPRPDDGSDYDDTKKDRDESKSLRKRFSKHVGRATKYMCMGANGHRAEEDNDIDLADLAASNYQHPVERDVQRYVAELLDDPEDTGNNRRHKNYKHSADDVRRLLRSDKSSDRFLGAMLDFYRQGNRLETVTIPMLSPEQMEFGVSCSLGFLVILNGSNPVTTFEEIYSEKALKVLQNLRKVKSSRRCSSDSLLLSGRITKKSFKKGNNFYARQKASQRKRRVAEGLSSHEDSVDRVFPENFRKQARVFDKPKSPLSHIRPVSPSARMRKSNRERKPNRTPSEVLWRMESVSPSRTDEHDRDESFRTSDHMLDEVEASYAG